MCVNLTGTEADISDTDWLKTSRFWSLFSGLVHLYLLRVHYIFLPVYFKLLSRLHVGVTCQDMLQCANKDKGDDFRLVHKLNVFYKVGNTFNRFVWAEICSQCLLVSNTEWKQTPQGTLSPVPPHWKSTDTGGFKYLFFLPLKNIA